MARRPPAQFEEWLDYCFTQGKPDFRDESSNLGKTLRDLRFLEDDRMDIVGHLTRLFESPEILIERYTTDQLVDGIRFIFGMGSGYIGRLISGEDDIERRIGCVQAMSTMFTRFFDRVCCLEFEPAGQRTIESAVFMIWDMAGIEHVVCFPHDHAAFVDPTIDLLRTALLECKSSACWYSGLHGIGHSIQMINNPQSPVQQQVTALVDAFLQRPGLSESVREYATRARIGYVQ